MSACSNGFAKTERHSYFVGLYEGLPKREGPKPGEIGAAVPVARVTPAGVTPSAWPIEVRGLANRSEGLGWPGPVDKSEGFEWAGLTQGPSIKVRGWGAGLAQGLSIKVMGWGPGWPANSGKLWLCLGVRC